MKSHFIPKNEEGFSLIELVVVIAVLSILASVGIPSFNCFQRRAKATAALTTIQQIKKECIFNKNQFTLSNIDGYIIDSEGISCTPNTQEIVLNPINDDFPTFKLNTTSNTLSYTYKGLSGTDLSRCMSFICDSSFNETGISNIALKNNIETNSFVIEDTYVERNCSAYVLVEGPTWQDAQRNARLIGGNLASLNNAAEYSWFSKQFAKDKYSYDGDTNPGDPENWVNLWIGGQYIQSQGSWEWGSGENFDVNEFIGDDDPGIGTGKGTDSVDLSSDKFLLAHFNHNKDENQFTRHGNGEGTFYFDATSGTSNNTRGIAEIKTC